LPARIHGNGSGFRHYSGVYPYPAVDVSAMDFRVHLLGNLPVMC